MKTLKLTIKKKWFDLIEKGIKKEEYREIKYFWIKRLTLDYKDLGAFDCSFKIKEFDFIHFFNGGHYSDKLPNAKYECLGIELREGKQEWGAEPNEQYFVIKLGKKIEQ